MTDIDTDTPDTGPGPCGQDFDEFYRCTFEYIFKAALREARWHRQAAEDSTQQAYAVLLNQWNRRVPKNASISPDGGQRRRDLPLERNCAYVRAIAINQVRTWRRNWHRSIELSKHSEDLYAVTQFDSVLVRDEFIRAIKDAPQRQQQVAVMIFLGDLSPAEVANRLGIDASTVRTHLDRARDRLMPYFKKLREAYGGRRPEDD